jgi:hypothetical protein
MVRRGNTKNGRTEKSSFVVEIKVQMWSFITTTALSTFSVLTEISSQRGQVKAIETPIREEVHD